MYQLLLASMDPNLLRSGLEEANMTELLKLVFASVSLSVIVPLALYLSMKKGPGHREAWAAASAFLGPLSTLGVSRMRMSFIFMTFCIVLVGVGWEYIAFRFEPRRYIKVISDRRLPIWTVAATLFFVAAYHVSNYLYDSTGLFGIPRIIWIMSSMVYGIFLIRLLSRISTAAEIAKRGSSNDAGK